MAAPIAATGPMPRIVALLASGLRDAGCEVVEVPWGGGGSSVSQRIRDRGLQVARLWRAALRAGPDVVLLQTSHDWAAIVRDLAAAAALRPLRPRLVLELHGSRADLLTGAGSRALKVATRLLLRLVDGVLVLSSEEKQAFERFFPGGRFSVVTNPFLPPGGAVTPRPSEDGGQPTVLFASRLLPQKGVFETVEAFAAVVRRVPSRLVVAGDGPAAEALRTRARELGVAERVDLPGRVAPERLQELFAAAALFVLPTYREGFPTVVSEAMSAGLPVVTSPVCGNADHLVDGTNALFVPPRDAQAVATAIERLLTDEPLRLRMSEANREKVKEFAPERVTGDYVRALREVVEG